MTDPAQIAKSLSEAQRHTMCNTTSRQNERLWICQTAGPVLQALEAKGLMAHSNNPTYFTPLGLTVRAILIDVALIKRLAREEERFALKVCEK